MPTLSDLLLGSTPTGQSSGLFSAPAASGMFQPPALMNLVRNPSNPSRAQITWSQPQAGSTPTTSPFTPMTPVSPTAITPNTPTPPATPVDWTSLITNLVTALTGGTQTPTTPTQTPTPPPTGQTQEPKLPTGTAIGTDVDPNQPLPALNPATQAPPPPPSLPSTSVQTIEPPPTFPASPLTPTDSQQTNTPTPPTPPTTGNVSVIEPPAGTNLMPGGIAGGPTQVPGTSLTTPTQPTGTVSVIDNPASGDWRDGDGNLIAAPTATQIAQNTTLAGILGAAGGAGAAASGGGFDPDGNPISPPSNISPVTVSPSVLGGGGITPGGISGGPAVVQVGKTGSGDITNLNDVINGGITASGLFGPLGLGTGAGLAKGLYQSVDGDTYNTNGLSALASGLYGPSFGERAGTFLGGLFGGGSPQLPISAANEPGAQVSNSSLSGGGSLVPGLATSSPATASADGFSPLVAGNSSSGGAQTYFGGLFGGGGPVGFAPNINLNDFVENANTQVTNQSMFNALLSAGGLAGAHGIDSLGGSGGGSGGNPMMTGGGLIQMLDGLGAW